jgi:integral membrane protein
MSSENTAPAKPGATSSTEADELRPIKGLAGALTRFRVMAFVTGVVLAFMTVVGLPFKYLLGETALWYTIGWQAHGWLYIIYVAVTLDLVFRLRWHLGRAILILLAGTIPFMSFVAERYVTKRVRPILAAQATSQRSA